MAGRRKSKIDPRRALFIANVLEGKSGAEAARCAGYNEKRAAQMASRLMADEGVKAEIDRGLAAIREGAEVTAESMIRQFDADRQFAISSGNASAATRATELKAKLCGLMPDRVDVRAAHLHANAEGPENSEAVKSGVEDFKKRILELAKQNGGGPDENAVAVIAGRCTQRDRPVHDAFPPNLPKHPPADLNSQPIDGVSAMEVTDTRRDGPGG